MTSVLVVRGLPFRAGQNLLLAEAAALVAWALENGLEAAAPTWLLVAPEHQDLSVGIQLAAPPAALPDGLRALPAPSGPGELHPLCFDAFRSGPARWFRIDHDPEHGHPIAATAHEPVAAPVC